MATIREHNRLIRVMFGGTKHFRHVLTMDDLAKLNRLEERYPYSRRPVCEHCESLAYWDKGGEAFCPKCGTITHNPITLSEYYVKGYDLDGSAFARHKERDLRDREDVLPRF